MSPTTEHEVNAFITNLNAKKTSGHDECPARLLIDGASVIAKPLAYIFNLSFMFGVFPKVFKLAKVSPIYKKGATDDPGNYRPISILPLLSRVILSTLN